MSLTSLYGYLKILTVFDNIKCGKTVINLKSLMVSKVGKTFQYVDCTRSALKLILSLKTSHDNNLNQNIMYIYI